MARYQPQVTPDTAMRLRPRDVAIERRSHGYRPLFDVSARERVIRDQPGFPAEHSRKVIHPETHGAAQGHRLTGPDPE